MVDLRVAVMHELARMLARRIDGRLQCHETGRNGHPVIYCYRKGKKSENAPHASIHFKDDGVLVRYNPQSQINQLSGASVFSGVWMGERSFRYEDPGLLADVVEFVKGECYR